MAQGLVSRLLDAEALNEWFDANSGDQYTGDLLFSTVFDLMLSVVCQQKSSVHEAYRQSDEEIGASITAVYNKLSGISTETSAKLVREIANRCDHIIRELNGKRPELLEGFKVKMLDGNWLESSERRLKVLRDQSPGPLPGKSLVVFSPALGLAIDVFPCEDGHAQERSLMPAVLNSVEKDDLWIADRNFCTIGTMLSIDRDNAFFVIRQHKNTPFEEIDKPKYIGRSEGNSVYEHQVLIKDKDGNQASIRRTIIKLKDPTRDGDQELAVFSNLPKEAANAKTVMSLYKKRWSIETSFQHLEKNMNSEINSLGYPKAALFGFCIAIVASNLFEVIYGTLRGLYGHEEIDDNFSSYYATSEMASVHDGMILIVPEEDWAEVVEMNDDEFISFLQKCSENVKLKKYQKAKWGPKKPKPKRINKGEPHVSTYKLLLEQKKACKSPH